MLIIKQVWEMLKFLKNIVFLLILKMYPLKMYNLINFVKLKVKEKTGITLELELEIVN